MDIAFNTHTVDKVSDWYCPTCKAYLVDERVTFEEYCDTCGTKCEIHHTPKPQVDALVEALEEAINILTAIGLHTDVTIDTGDGKNIIPDVVKRLEQALSTHKDKWYERQDKNVWGIYRKL